MAEYTINIEHSVILSSEIVTPQIVIGNTATIDQEVSSNYFFLDWVSVLTFEHAVAGTRQIKWYDTLFLDSDLVLDNLDDLERELSEHTLSFDHTIVVSKESTRILESHLGMLSEFQVYKLTKGLDYGDA